MTTFKTRHLTSAFESPVAIPLLSIKIWIPLCDLKSAHSITSRLSHAKNRAYLKVKFEPFECSVQNHRESEKNRYSSSMNEKHRKKRNTRRIEII